MNLDEASTKRAARIGGVVSTILYSHSPSTYSMVASIIGVQLWLEGASHRIFRTLNYLAVSQGVDAIRSHVDQLRTYADNKLVYWKLTQEV